MIELTEVMRLSDDQLARMAAMAERQSGNCYGWVRDEAKKLAKELTDEKTRRETAE